ncbi:MAG: DNA primase [Candidatus Omnitrophica bacterium]|nr:DNA primase [Candidatus Omnitrophota bacterium]
MAIPDNIVDQVQARSDIVEVVSRYIPLQKAGRNFKAPCPFHNEKTPSFVVSPDKQIYHCFGCGAGGNVFSFLMKYENLSFPEVVEMLADKAGIQLPRFGPRKELTSLATQLYKVNELAIQFFEGCLPQNREVRDYLVSRGITAETAKLFRIGYSQDSWDGVLKFLGGKDIKGDIAEKAGLAIASDRGGYYDRFRKRLIFPIFDLKDRALGFGGRVLDSSLPKYMNSPETYVYSKGRNLYGLNHTKESIKKAGYALVVEGYLDFIIPYQSGIRNIVATLGTALTIDQVKLLKRFASTVIMVYDPDEAGEAASLRNMDLFISEGVNVYVAELPKGFDPDGYIRKFGTEDFIKLTKASKNLFDYKISRLSMRFDIKSAHGKASIAGEMLPTISRIENAVLRSNLVKKLAEKLSVDEDSIRQELKKVKPDYTMRVYSISPVEAKRDSKSAQKMVLALLLDGESFVKKIRESLSPDEFKDSSVRDVIKAVLDLSKEDRSITAVKLMNYFENNDAATALISESVHLSETLDNKERILCDCIARIKKDNVKDSLGRLQDAIKIAHDSKDDTLVTKLVTEYTELLKVNPAPS